MNIREKAVEFVRSHPDSSAKQIADGAGIPRRIIQTVLAELLMSDVLHRHLVNSRVYSYRLVQEEEFTESNQKYRALREKAMSREQAGLWRRAAHFWLLAMDAARDEETRGRAAARREHCISCGGALRTHSEGSSVSSVSVPHLDLWRDF
ncbi:PerC family transcriptional regulator [Erwinia sp. SLM-02]|uniref:PerC family transcriptional regulator n=1 Tax=Erwinia sp. SLM-02 TaxID=3020057 RepID=UPI003080AC2A